MGRPNLFIGDSLIFGETLPDSETMVSQFAQSLQPPAHVVNLGVPGYGLDNLVRALETGRYDSFRVGKVKAVVSWIAPWHLERVTGDAQWMAKSPRAVRASALPSRPTSMSHCWRGSGNSRASASTRRWC